MNEDATPVDKKRSLARGTITIAHASVTGTCAKLAQKLYDALKSTIPPTVTLQLGTLEEWDWWDELLNRDEEDSASTTLCPPLVIFFLPTNTGGTWTTSASALQTALQDLQNDWRIEKSPLRSSELHIAAFGMGSSAYDASTMGQPARDAFRQLRSLGAKPLTTAVGVGDDAVGDHVQDTFVPWENSVLQSIQAVLAPHSQASSCACGSSPADGCCHADEKKDDDAEIEEEYDDFGEEEDAKEPEVMDLEDMGDSMMASGEANQGSEAREMVTPSQAAALKKEGYKLIGTHSAVKLCRWTKHQLRGRGGCYKHTFYGITSYQCMEATPSLACANKCVFCWRHHKNPVGKEWRWKTDDPHFIVDEAVKTHVSMIKEARGIPGVRMDRWQEAHTVRHCALSLVGEPIMYPRIDELLGDLHSRKISTFLVTNGQHPAAIASLRPITQLYVSVDAPTPESLIAIDRPLFNDAWDRLKQSLSSLKAKGQRTVARLTVVKGWNSDEVEGYAKLIALGHVSLVEVKGVTFCGKSDASNLNMSNTPWHHEVVALTQTLQQELAKLRATATKDPPPEYGLACEHKHSCSVLLARVDQFSVEDPATGERRWRTWIDYDKFHELAARNTEDPTFTFSVEDYTAETPSWALFGAAEEGFDPTDTRHRKKKKHPKYTQFDEKGIPTHDHNNQALSEQERVRLYRMMEERMKEIGSSTTVTELKGGEKAIQDASLMFRGMVIAK
jgi:tRNA wybutosine-synthesizing protein 1